MGQMEGGARVSKMRSALALPSEHEVLARSGGTARKGWIRRSGTASA